MSDVDKNDPVEQLISKAKPLFAQLSFGSVIGYCSGAAAKKVGKMVAVMAGLAFITIQSAASAGYVTVDWNKVKDDAIAKVDTDGDGEITASDAKVYWRKVKTILTKNVPNAGGFGLGFLYGLRS